MMSLVTAGTYDNAAVPITETWTRLDWSYFDTYQGATDGNSLGRYGSAQYPFGLSTQEHINLRAFTAAEAWGTGFTTGYVASANHWPGATVTVPVGTASWTSVANPIDLTVLGEGELVIALPNFPLGSITLNQSYLDLSSDGFSSAVCSLSWANSTPAPSAGNTSLIWPYSALEGIDLTKVNGVRFRITATSATTVYLLGLRLISPEWVRTNVDFDNYTGQLRQSIPLNGDPSAAPVPANQQIPIMLRSAVPAGDQDPAPINGAVSAIFNTGSQTQSNSLRLYMRELSTAYQTQIDLEGTTQIALTGQPQPTSGVSEYVPRTVGDLDQYTMSQLNQNTMLELERTSDPQYISWQGAFINWGPGGSLTLTNSTGAAGYQYTGTDMPTFANNTTYLAVFSLSDSSARLIIYNVDQTTLAITGTLCDTGLIPDASLFTRRAGRVGFQVQLLDGDAYVGAIRPMGLTYAQYQSEPFTSKTPVMGARLYVHNSPDPQYWKSWTALGSGAVAPDTDRSTTGQSTRVTVTSTAGSGVISNQLTADDCTGITDFAQLSLSFDLWVPSALGQGASLLTASLVSVTGASVPLALPPIAYDHWQHVDLSLPNTAIASGIYQLKLSYGGTNSGQFWIDNVIVKERAVAWSARSVTDDPWQSNFAPWTPFNDFVNDDNAGVRFYPQGKNLQMQALARKSNAVILSAPKLVPVYAQLGRFAWPENALASLPAAPTASVTGTNVSGNTWNFTGSGTSTVKIISYQWSFSDGAYASGPYVQHTFTTNPPQYATLLVMDQYGQTGITQWVHS